MSRFEVKHEDKALAFGDDWVLGEFLMIWIRPKDPKERAMQDRFGPDPDEVIVDLDKKFEPKFNREMMLKLLAEHGFSESELADAKEIKVK